MINKEIGGLGLLLIIFATINLSVTIGIIGLVLSAICISMVVISKHTDREDIHGFRKIFPIACFIMFVSLSLGLENVVKLFHNLI